MIWILLPAYNEAESLPRLLPKIADEMNRQNESYSIVVVDDGSTDDTPTLLKDYAQTFPLEVITHTLNRGLGETERDGFEYVAGRCKPDDTIVRMDCDDTHEPSYISALRDKLSEGFDVVNTSRFQSGGAQMGVSAYRATISYLANLFVRFAYRIPGTRDYSCGFRAYRGRIIQDAINVYGDDFIQLRGLGFTSTLETIIKLHLLGARFSEVPFVLRYDQKVSSSKMISSITSLGYLIMVLLYFWPFGGWLNQFKGLGKLYRDDPNQAVERFGADVLRRSTASRIQI